MRLKTDVREIRSLINYMNEFFISTHKSLPYELLHITILRGMASELALKNHKKFLSNGVHKYTITITNISIVALRIVFTKMDAPNELLPIKYEIDKHYLKLVEQVIKETEFI